jgi:hypothetical protein
MANETSNTNVIRDRATYHKNFPCAVRSEALKVALDIRKFEIDLYWKRAGYFWTLIVAAFGAYFALRNVDHIRDTSSIFIVTCVGSVLSMAWYLTNRGSKYWQENWERHVDALEDEIVGPLYKTTLSEEEFPFLKLHRGYPFSVSKINQLVSLFVTLVWFGLAVRAFPQLPWNERVGTTCAYAAMAIVTVLFVVLLFFFGKGSSEGRVRNINFRRSELGPIDPKPDKNGAEKD